MLGQEKKAAGGGGMNVDHTFTEEVLSTLGWVCFFAAIGAFVFSGGAIAAVTAIGAVEVASFLALGVGFFYLASRERKKQESDDKEKTIRVELAQGQKSITIDLAAPTPEQAVENQKPANKFTNAVKREREQDQEQSNVNYR